LAADDPTGLAVDLRRRKLFKRALDLPAGQVPGTVVPWLDSDPDQLEAAENAVAGELGLGPDTVLIDYPSRTSMLGVDLPLLTRDGSVERLTDEGRVGQLGLPRIAGELYLSARRLRMFTREPVESRGIPRSISGG
jgi:hypothetical protein